MTREVKTEAFSPEKRRESQDQEAPPRAGTEAQVRLVSGTRTQFRVTRWSEAGWGERRSVRLVPWASGRGLLPMRARGCSPGVAAQLAWR